MIDEKFFASLNESQPSGSKYEDEERESEPGELEDEESDTRIQIGKKGPGGSKKQKKGLVTRDQISAAAAAIPDNSSPSLRLSVMKGGTRVGSNRSPG